MRFGSAREFIPCARRLERRVEMTATPLRCRAAAMFGEAQTCIRPVDYKTKAESSSQRIGVEKILWHKCALAHSVQGRRGHHAVPRAVLGRRWQSRIFETKSNY